MLFILLMASLAIWYWSLSSVSVYSVKSPGDWTADSAGLGYLGGAGIFVVLLALVGGVYLSTNISRTILFWAFTLTRPLGTVVGDFLDKPISKGGLALSRYSASAVLIVFIIAIVLIFRQRAAGALGH
jgi:uncharacterized membrane-anchored protein